MNKNYKCDTCGYTTNRKSNLLTHFKKKNPCSKKNPTHSCEICGKIFKNKNSIYAHRKICITKELKIKQLEEQLKKTILEKESYKLEKKEIKKKLEEKDKRNAELITTNKDLMITNKFLIKDTIKLLIRENKENCKRKNNTIKLLIRENKKLRKSVEKHKTMNMWGCSKVQLEWLKLKSIVDNTFIIN